MIKIIQHQLDGVLLAQHESYRLGRPVRIVLADTGPMDSTYGDTLKRVLSLRRRPGVNRLTAVDLNMHNTAVSHQFVTYEYGGDFSHDVALPLFPVRGFSHSTGDQLSPLHPDARTDFDRQLAESLMESFISFKLKKYSFHLLMSGEQIYSSSGILSRATIGISRKECSSAQQSAFLYEDQRERVGLFLDALVHACGINQIQLVMPNSLLAEYLQQIILMKSYPTLDCLLPGRRSADFSVLQSGGRGGASQ